MLSSFFLISRSFCHWRRPQRRLRHCKPGRRVEGSVAVFHQLRVFSLSLFLFLKQHHARDFYWTNGNQPWLKQRTREREKRTAAGFVWFRSCRMVGAQLSLRRALVLGGARNGLFSTLAFSVSVTTNRGLRMFFTFFRLSLSAPSWRSVCLARCASSLWKLPPPDVSRCPGSRLLRTLRAAWPGSLSASVVTLYLALLLQRPSRGRGDGEL